MGHWNDKTLFMPANIAWDHVNYDFINRQVAIIENRMQRVLDANGKMITH